MTTSIPSHSYSGAVNDSFVMMKRCVRRSLRDPEAFFTALTLPVILMLLFVYVFGGAMQTGVAYVNYVVPGIIVLCAGFGAGTTSVAVAQDMSNGLVDRFRSMPVASGSLLIGHVGASVLRNLLATLLVIGAGVLVGWRPTGSLVDWLAALALIVFFVLALSWLAAVFGVLASGPESANLMTIVFMFLPYVSTAFVPADTMPHWLRGFAEYQPVTPIIETLRGLWMGTDAGNQPVIALVWCGGILLCAVVAARRAYDRRVMR